ncbi:lipocalin-15 [Trichomycterus rosablanca]|uniref:lipocalin-15 n=1 Tax=Trichomycterus rosablanca TaxID=2290929 RepID=UPI002F350ADE
MLLTVAVLCSIVLWTHSLNFTNIQPQQDFNLEQFTGEWYRLGVAYDYQLFIKYKDKMQINKGFLVLNEDSGANLTMWSMDRHKVCTSSFYEYEKTDIPGFFTYFSERHKIQKDITVVETNYTDYGIVLKYKKMNKDYTQLALYGRTPDISPEVRGIFRSYALSLGFPEESIATPFNVDPCPLTEQRNTTEVMD